MAEEKDFNERCREEKEDKMELRDITSHPQGHGTRTEKKKGEREETKKFSKSIYAILGYLESPFGWVY